MNSEDHRVTGQIFFRHTRERKDNRRLIMLAGILAVPDDIKILSEHQYTAFSMSYIDLTDPILPLALHLPSGKDISGVSVGLGLGSLVTQPIWRV
jgi:hypothetical protein